MSEKKIRDNRSNRDPNPSHVPLSQSQQEVSKSGDQVKSKTKNQNAKRQFGCPCGKEYLSYPALFTHIKQKHGGKAPGQIKKPKTQKARGRPRLPTVNMEQDNSVEQYEPKDELNRILENRSINYNEHFQSSSGSSSKSCQDMATQFLTEHSIEKEQTKILTCFLNYIKFYVSISQGDSYWKENSPNEIIDFSNRMVRELDDNKTRFPLSRELLIELLFVLFRWMYKQKWTDHKLVRRAQENVQSPATMAGSREK